jgi:hypothetical protein
MGFFRRGAAALNQADPVTSAVIALSPSIRRVDKLLANGTTANGVVTGVRFSLNDSTVRKEFAISVQTAAGWQRIGVRTQPPLAHRLRLGVPVVVKLDGERGVLDWESMAQAWGLGDQFLSQESMRRPPDDGVVDTALDSRVQRHLAKWSRTTATIVSLSRRTMMGMPTQNWDIVLRLADGSTSTSKGDDVPSYAQWYAAPGVTVPVVVDPKDSSRAAIDWPAFALTQFDTVGFDDDPPAGSIAAELEARSGSGAGVAMSATPIAAPSPSAGPVELDRTLRGWVDAVRGGHMGRAEFEQSLADWQTAGMCTAAHAAAAREAVVAT